MTSPEKYLQVFASKLGKARTVQDDSSASSSNAGAVDASLSGFFSDESSTCSVPCFKMDADKYAGVDAADCIAQLSQKLDFRKVSVGLVPNLILQHVSQTFGQLIDARLIQCLQMMLEMNESNFDVETAKTVSILSTTKVSPTPFTSAETSFRGLSVEKGGFAKEDQDKKTTVLPLIFKATIQISVLGVKPVKVVLAAPGTISGSFNALKQQMNTVDVTIDTQAVYQSMKSRCDQVIITECLRTARELALREMVKNMQSTPKTSVRTTATITGPSTATAVAAGISASPNTEQDAKPAASVPTIPPPLPPAPPLFQQPAAALPTPPALPLFQQPAAALPIPPALPLFQQPTMGFFQQLQANAMTATTMQQHAPPPGDTFALNAPVGFPPTGQEKLTSSVQAVLPNLTLFQNQPAVQQQQPTKKSSDEMFKSAMQSLPTVAAQKQPELVQRQYTGMAG